MCLLVSILCLYQLVDAQNFTISGSIKESKNGEDLIGATVRVLEIKEKGARSNSYGFYSLSIPKGSYTLVYQYLGYEKQEVKINIDKNTVRNIQLVPIERTIKDVVGKAVKADKNVTRNEMR